MMKVTLTNLFWIASLLMMVNTSCEKVIDIKLNEAAQKIVIEGTIVNRSDSQFVHIHRSVPFTASNRLPAVSGAKVSIKNNALNSVVTLIEKRPGVYYSFFTGRPGRTYTLTVETGGVVYTALSTMPEQVKVDSVGVSSTSFFGRVQKSLQLIYKDPATVKNYYRCVLSINGVLSKNIFVFDDIFTNGNTVNQELFDFDLNAKTGDKADIEFQCIDAAMHKYWLGLSQNENRGGASTTPANPVNNINNGALGYFSAHTVQIEKVIIP